MLYIKVIVVVKYFFNSFQYKRVVIYMFNFIQNNDTTRKKTDKSIC